MGPCNVMGPRIENRSRLGSSVTAAKRWSLGVTSRNPRNVMITGGGDATEKLNGPRTQNHLEMSKRIVEARLSPKKKYVTDSPTDPKINK